MAIRSFISGTLLFYFSISMIGAQNEYHKEIKDWTKVNPPNGIEIEYNFYADETEVSNHNWKEYLKYIQSVFGKKSEQYINAIPDTTVWLKQGMIPHLYKIYFRDPFYDDFPVVGITLNQAKAYCKWRSDRVAEMLLIEQGCMNPNPNATPENHFTIDRYRSKEYQFVNTWCEMPFPIFRLPTNDEWELFAGKDTGFEYGVDPETDENYLVQKEMKSLFCTLEYIASEQNEFSYETHEGTRSERLITTASSLSFAKNVFGIFHTIGNVSEMIDEEDISKGGSWKDKLSDIKIINKNMTEVPNCWTGFRCVSSWEE